MKISINDFTLNVKGNATILQLCDLIGINIPRFCYHERLSIAGNCRMCLVEVEKSIKPVVACAMPVMDGMKIHTESLLVKKVRENVLEFLLLNHPLDCPICDQGGECDLQDLSMVYGSDRGRFYGYKRTVEDKNCGPLIKTIMTRCIHCTRCVRFADEVAGVPVLGTIGRGETTEISTYVDKVFKSELSGNVIDLCPVGALTSKPYAFTTRSWELDHVESIDLNDSFGSNVRIDYKGNKIVRILPKYNPKTSEEWITDKTRFSYDGFKQQRILQPMLKSDLGQFELTSWKDMVNSLSSVLNSVKGNEIGFIVGDTTDNESLFLTKLFASYCGSANIHSVLKANDISFETFFTHTLSKEDINNSDVCLFVGLNPRNEIPLLNVQLRKKVLEDPNFKIYSIGPYNDLTYDVNHLGLGVKTLMDIAEGKHLFCSVLKNAKNPIVFIGDEIVSRKDQEGLLNLISNIFIDQLKLTYKNISLIHSQGNQVGINNIGIHTGRDFMFNYNDIEFLKKTKVLYLINVDSLPNLNYELLKEHGIKIIYQHSHGSKLASYADYLLPATTVTEKEGTFTNFSGLHQKTKTVLSAPGNPKADWKILYSFLITMFPEKTKNLVSIWQDRWIKYYMNFASPRLLDGYADDNYKTFVDFNHVNFFKFKKNKIYNTEFNPWINNYYLTNIITKSSQIMTKCSKSLINKETFINKL